MSYIGGVFDVSKTFFFLLKKRYTRVLFNWHQFFAEIVLFGSVTAESGFHLYLSLDFSFIYLYFAIN